jgi:transposase-like protein
VRWYGRFRLSLRDVCDLLAERGVDVSSRTVLSWVHTFGPLLAAEFRRRARPLGSRWYVDETYVRVGGAWVYLYRAVDEEGQLVDVLLLERHAFTRLESVFFRFRRSLEQPIGEPVLPAGYRIHLLRGESEFDSFLAFRIADSARRH